jgi:tRNA pseudouridine13 synthase
LGELKGNHFKLLLKNLRFDENNMDTTTLDLDGVVSSGMEILSSLGFINYYGMQRFGSYSVSTKDVGREVMKQNWIKVNFYCKILMDFSKISCFL